MQRSAASSAILPAGAIARLPARTRARARNSSKSRSGTSQTKWRVIRYSRSVELRFRCATLTATSSSPAARPHQAAIASTPKGVSVGGVLFIPSISPSPRPMVLLLPRPGSTGRRDHRPPSPRPATIVLSVRMETETSRPGTGEHEGPPHWRHVGSNSGLHDTAVAVLDASDCGRRPMRRTKAAPKRRAIHAGHERPIGRQPGE